MSGSKIPLASVMMTGRELQRYQGMYRMSSGGSFVVSVKNGGLTLDSEGRDAVAVLTYTDAERSSSPLTDRCKAVFDSMSHGDFDPLKEIVGPQAALDHTTRFRTFWRDWVSTLGPYHGTQILITTPTGSRISTFIQLNFEKVFRLFVLLIARVALSLSVEEAYRRGRLSLPCASATTNSPTLISVLARTW